MRTKTIAPMLALLVVASVVTPVAATAVRNQSAQSDAYAETFVSFETSGSAIVDYTVNNATIAESVAVQSQSEASTGGGLSVGAGLSGMTSLAGSALSIESSTSTQASVQAESGATLTVHDNGHGSLVVDPGDSSQYVLVDVSSESSAAADGDSRVVVTTSNGTEAAVLAVGNASVTVNDEGDVSGEVGQDGRLVVRSYAEGRSESAEAHEDMIVEGTAKASVYLMQEGDETVSDTVSYGSNTTVEVTESAEGEVRMTAERATSEGTVVITEVHESVVAASDDLQVTVDAEAAAEVSSYSELEGAFGSDSSRYMVESATQATAQASVLVGVNHFSTREITMTESGSSGGDGSATETDQGDGSSGDDPTETPGQPGFGPVVAIAALGALVVALRRRA